MAQHRGYFSHTVYIASIWPSKMPSISKNFGLQPENHAARRITFNLEPVERGGEPFILPVSDCFESIMDPMQSDGKRKSFNPRLVGCEEIATALVNEWATGFPGAPAGAQPGIMVIEGDKPTEDELAHMTSVQAAFMAWAFGEGERLHREAKYGSITPTMQVAAKWLGKDNIWANPSKAADTATCPWCATIIPAQAYVCQQCTRPVRKAPPEMAALLQRPAAPAAMAA